MASPFLLTSFTPAKAILALIGPLETLTALMMTSPAFSSRLAVAYSASVLGYLASWISFPSRKQANRIAFQFDTDVIPLAGFDFASTCRQ